MKRFYTLLLTIVSLTCAAQNPLTVEAPKVVAIDENFRVVFTANGKVEDFQWQGTDDFDILWGPQKGNMSSTTIVNGKRTSTHQETFTYILQPKSTGTFTIGSASAKVDGAECIAHGVKIEVVQSQQNATDQSHNQNQNQSQNQNYNQNQNRNDEALSTGNVSNQDIFLRLSLSKTNVVKGEPITAVLKIYTRTDITGFEDINFPTFNGFWSKETVSVSNLEFDRESVNGVIYNSALLRQYMLIPQQSGTLKIDPAEMVCQIRVRTSSGSPLSIFDDFFDQYQTIRKRISTPAINVTVRDLPAGAPSSFAGGVGTFDIDAKLNKDDIKSNDAASLTVTISGKGNISMLEAPKVTLPPDFEVYDIKSSDKISSDGTSGSKSFEFPFIPRSHGDYVIPDIEYSFYDINHGQYVTVHTGEIPITIEKGEDIDNAGVVIPGINRQSVKNVAEDVRYISLGDGKLRKTGSFFAGSWLFYALLAAVAFMGLLINKLVKFGEKRRADVVGTRHRKANKMARSRLKNAEGYLKQNLSGAYYEELHKALLGYVSDKLVIPVADLSKDTIREKLASRGVEQSTIDKLTDLVDKCEFARYSPASEHAQMEGEYNEAVDVISEIDSKIKTMKSKKTYQATAIVAVLLLMSSVAFAQDDASALWQQGNEAFAAQQWAKAIECYKAIEASGFQSDDLYYNMGTAYFKASDNGHAVLYLEKALELNPSHRDAKHNLEIAHQFTLDKIEEIPEFIVFTWIKDLRQSFSANVWAWITLVLALIITVLVSVFIHSKTESTRKLIFAATCLVLLITVVTFIFSIVQKHELTRHSSAIVTSPVSSVKSSPDNGGKTVFVLHEGTKVKLLDTVGDWTKIEISDGRQGWISASTTEEI